MTSTPYHSIPTVWRRDPETKHKTLIENAWENPALEALRDLRWEWTEKVDGTNIRLVVDNIAGPRIGGRTDNAQIPAPLVLVLQPILHRMTETFAAEIASGDHITLYGEGYGSKIQKVGEKYKPDGVDFVAFDLKVNRVWYRREAVESVADTLGVDTVPVLGFGPLDEAIEYAREGITSEWGNFSAEGLVMRPPVELLDNHGHRVITKIKTKDFGG